jgi:hypothetical protein
MAKNLVVDGDNTQESLRSHLSAFQTVAPFSLVFCPDNSVLFCGDFTFTS